MDKYTPFTSKDLMAIAYAHAEPPHEVPPMVIARLVVQAERGNQLAELVDHAIELGYLGDGSTLNWAKRVVADYRGET